MKLINKFSCCILVAAVCVTACQRNINYDADTIKADTTLTLKTAAPFALGVGVDYDSLMANGIYTATVLSQFANVTPGYVMKHGAIVQSNGSYNFTKADAMVTLVTGAGLDVYGHTLCWHANNNGNYLRALVAGGTPVANPNLIKNGSFESGISTNWWSAVGSGATASFSSETGEVFDKTKSMKVAVTTPGPASYTIQAVNDAWPATAGTSYKISFFAKSAVAGGSIKAVVQGSNYAGDKTFTTTTTWAEYSWNITVNETAPQVRFNFPAAGTYYIDSVSVTLTNPGSNAASVAEQRLRVDTTLKNFITAMVTRYKDKVHAWDVVNEPLDDNGVIRTGTSSSDVFYWGDYLGDRNAARDTVYTNGDSLLTRAFRYAHAADPTAKLFLNDYAHESNSRKMDSLIALVTRLKANGVPIDGVGLQMHMSYLNPNTGIDNALMKMAQLGLLVKITELDISVNLGSQTDPETANFVIEPTMFPTQAAKYRYVAESYIRNVPEAQRFGITIWGVSDKDSWLRARLPYHTKDYPLLWDESYNKKQAFTEFITGLQLK
jgi:endo-1,4-beta-xylanase